jgi:arylamine N-acetyltransferase
MRGTTWTRLALAGCGSAVCLLVAAPLAAAETTAPITLSPEESQQVCSDWVPKLQKHADTLKKRITGGPEVKGSVANLKARAADQRAAGHTARADQLDQRAAKRQSRVGELDAAKQKLDAFAAAHCGPAK